MNFLDTKQPRREAVIRYLDADFQILREGDFVRCAVTGDPIPLASLRYWNVGLQQPFCSAEAAFSELLKTVSQRLSDSSARPAGRGR
ncbi:MAG: DUF2093 domain-containing protein [Aestuariivirga sp.]|uniref:DUF2093 domain-containing protein n=1 Tax=Aestuariivirga sp. TaxID=2650926 RepID=UPI0025C44C68|nr:DUF2093 domain-containing protein [Aestuariivirga sp.]MCA3559705.1 DUF2093 domain-containing protein [Aestuariivirga sp.]